MFGLLTKKQESKGQESHLSSQVILQEIDELEEQLSTQDFPMVVFSNEGETLFQNKLFSDLKLNFENLCDLVKEGFFVTADTQGIQKYRIRERDHEGMHTFIFTPIIQKDSAHEVGIITSSIAHELNNPLAGIRGALEVMLLDEVDYQDQLSQMLGVVDRCQKLVNTFLGFSRQALDCNIGQVDFKMNVDQAMDLMKYRFLENQISPKLTYSKHAVFDHLCSSTFLVMTLYLCLNEALTSFEHQKLVRSGSIGPFMMKIEEEKSKVSFLFNFAFDHSEKLLKNRLLVYLLQSLGLRLRIIDGLQENGLVFDVVN